MKVRESYCQPGTYLIDEGWGWLWHDGKKHAYVCTHPWNKFNEGYWHTREEAEQFLREWENEMNKKELELKLEQAKKDQEAIAKNVKELESQLKEADRVPLKIGDILTSYYGRRVVVKSQFYPNCLALIDSLGNEVCWRDKDKCFVNSIYNNLYTKIGNVFEG